MSEVTPEQVLNKIKEIFKQLENSRVEAYDNRGTKANPYIVIVNERRYNEIQPYLDNDGMYLIRGYGWCKVEMVKPFVPEPKLHAVEKSGNPFCNTHKQPFYKPLYVKDKSMYALKVQGKWRKE